MRDIQAELRLEKEELDVKIERLGEFLKGRVFPTLPKLQQKLLVAQKGFMGSYSRILGERIQNLNG